MSNGTTGTVTSSLSLSPVPAPPPQMPGRACCACGSTSNLLIPAVEGTWICLNAQRCGGGGSDDR